MAETIDTKTGKVIKKETEPVKGKQPDDDGVIRSTIRIMQVKHK